MLCLYSICYINTVTCAKIQYMNMPCHDMSLVWGVLSFLRKKKQQNVNFLLNFLPLLLQFYYFNKSSLVKDMT